MKSVIAIDKQHRKIFKKQEALYLTYKSIIYNKQLSNTLRYKFYLKLCLLKKKGSIVRIKNYCLITTHSRSIIRKFRLSRIQIKQLARLNQIVGITKSS